MCSTKGSSRPGTIPGDAVDNLGPYGPGRILRGETFGTVVPEAYIQKGPGTPGREWRA